MNILIALQITLQMRGNEKYQGRGRGRSSRGSWNRSNRGQNFSRQQPRYYNDQREDQREAPYDSRPPIMPKIEYPPLCNFDPNIPRPRIAMTIRQALQQLGLKTDVSHWRNHTPVQEWYKYDPDFVYPFPQTTTSQDIAAAQAPTVSRVVKEPLRHYPDAQGKWKVTRNENAFKDPSASNSTGSATTVAVVAPVFPDLRKELVQRKEERERGFSPPRHSLRHYDNASSREDRDQQDEKDRLERHALRDRQDRERKERRELLDCQRRKHEEREKQNVHTSLPPITHPIQSIIVNPPPKIPSLFNLPSLPPRVSFRQERANPREGSNQHDFQPPSKRARTEEYSQEEIDAWNIERSWDLTNNPVDGQVPEKYRRYPVPFPDSRQLRPISRKEVLEVIQVSAFHHVRNLDEDIDTWLWSCFDYGHCYVVIEGNGEIILISNPFGLVLCVEDDCRMRWIFYNLMTDSNITKITTYQEATILESMFNLKVNCQYEAVGDVSIPVEIRIFPDPEDLEINAHSTLQTRIWQFWQTIMSFSSIPNMSKFDNLSPWTRLLRAQSADLNKKKKDEIEPRSVSVVSAYLLRDPYFTPLGFIHVQDEVPDRVRLSRGLEFFQDDEEDLEARLTKTREVSGAEECSYPLCPSQTEHALFDCPTITLFCSVCLRRGHSPNDHEDRDQVELEHLFLIWSPSHDSAGAIWRRNNTANRTDWRNSLYRRGPFSVLKFFDQTTLRAPEPETAEMIATRREQMRMAEALVLINNKLQLLESRRTIKPFIEPKKIVAAIETAIEKTVNVDSQPSLEIRKPTSSLDGNGKDSLGNPTLNPLVVDPQIPNSSTILDSDVVMNEEETEKIRQFEGKRLILQAQAFLREEAERDRKKRQKTASSVVQSVQSNSNVSPPSSLDQACQVTTPLMKVIDEEMDDDKELPPDAFSQIGIEVPMTDISSASLPSLPIPTFAVTSPDQDLNDRRQLRHLRSVRNLYVSPTPADLAMLAYTDEEADSDDSDL